ncbi:MAG: hypothetical protein HBSAPP03_09250 [Phycisphaerae bacterium]|nr:MAG: hypothetical protein HBSAPP03_09250 [Phycisphaerae bacterium]
MLSVVIITFRRLDALRRTLTALHPQGGGDGRGVGDHTPDSRVCCPLPPGSEIIVADNASCDGTLDMLTREFPHVRVVALDANLGVEAFNRAAALARGDVLLILDDDAIPDGSSLLAALNLLAREPPMAAVALHPVHAATGVSEWPFAKAARGGWPVMGCGNLIRTDAWKRVGGYEGAFFLYRNDVDLALKLLGAGLDVWFDPAWVVRHDSPPGVKSDRWLRLATRNWVWLARRHGRGMWMWLGASAGVLWALRHAGWRPTRWGCVLAGARDGLTARPPTAGVRGGQGWRELLRLRTP